MSYIYLYGMILKSETLLLEGAYPVADHYGEIKKRGVQLGGETGVAAAVLASLGCNVKLSGPHLGTQNRDFILEYFKDKSVDTSLMAYNPEFEGVTDLVMIDKDTRTCFGRFAYLFGQKKEKWYDYPNEEGIRNCKIAGLDPFFDEKVIEYCLKYDKPYAIIDCKHDTACNKHCAVNAISREFLESNYQGMTYEDVFKLYTDNTDGLVIFTMGSQPVWYGRKGQQHKTCPTFPIMPVSTLGAGDCFKAGTIYGLYNELPDDELVRFATAVAADACTRFPVPDAPPTLESVNAMLNF